MNAPAEAGGTRNNRTRQQLHEHDNSRFSILHPARTVRRPCIHRCAGRQRLRLQRMQRLRREEQVRLRLPQTHGLRQMRQGRLYHVHALSRVEHHFGASR